MQTLVPLASFASSKRSIILKPVSSTDDLFCKICNLLPTILRAFAFVMCFHLHELGGFEPADAVVFYNTIQKVFSQVIFISSLRLFSLNCRPCHIAFSTNGCKMSVGILISSGNRLSSTSILYSKFFSTLQIQVAGKVRAFAILYRVLCFLLRHKAKPFSKVLKVLRGICWHYLLRQVICIPVLSSCN